MAYEKIVVGTDGSPTARVAEQVAVRIAGATQGRLTVLSVQAGEDGEPARAALEGARENAERHGIQPETRALNGEPADAIVEFADREDADLIVVGDVGMGGPRRFRLGGVADRISHAMPCDLLIVRTSRADTTKAPPTYENVLIATDGSATADHAARTGTDLAVALGAGVSLVNVGDEFMGRIILKDTAERLGDVDLPTTVVKGDPGERIAEVAGEGRYDLVVVGNKGMSGRLRFLMGVVPDRVSHLASCDVLVVNTVGRSPEGLGPGDGAIVLVNGEKIAAYRDQSGKLVALSPKCKHLGCTVGWNDGAKTWDCPCHGSRYDARGKVIQGPAERDLDPVKV